MRIENHQIKYAQVSPVPRLRCQRHLLHQGVTGFQTIQRSELTSWTYQGFGAVRAPRNSAGVWTKFEAHIDLPEAYDGRSFRSRVRCACHDDPRRFPLVDLRGGVCPARAPTISGGLGAPPQKTPLQAGNVVHLITSHDSVATENPLHRCEGHEEALGLCLI